MLFSVCSHSHHPDRFPSAPIITEGYPKNLTVLENTTNVQFDCPILSDLGAHIEWTKSLGLRSTIPANISKLEVKQLVMEFDCLYSFFVAFVLLGDSFLLFLFEF